MGGGRGLEGRPGNQTCGGLGVARAMTSEWAHSVAFHASGHQGERRTNQVVEDLSVVDQPLSRDPSACATSHKQRPWCLPCSSPASRLAPTWSAAARIRGGVVTTSTALVLLWPPLPHLTLLSSHSPEVLPRSLYLGPAFSGPEAKTVLQAPPHPYTADGGPRAAGTKEPRGTFMCIF